MRYLVESETGNIYEVTNLYDHNGEPTERSLVATCVIKYSHDKWEGCSIRPSEIHPVH